MRNRVKTIGSVCLSVCLSSTQNHQIDALQDADAARGVCVLETSSSKVNACLGIEEELNKRYKDYQQDAGRASDLVVEYINYVNIFSILDLLISAYPISKLFL